jgi:YD repeat-containing protein
LFIFVFVQAQNRENPPTIGSANPQIGRSCQQLAARNSNMGKVAVSCEGRLCGVEYSDGSFEQYAYDDGGLLREAKNANSHIKITRDQMGRIVEEWQDGHTVTSLYGKNGRRGKVTGSLGADLSMSYTAGDLLQGMKSGGWEMSLKHDARGLEIERVLSGGVVCRSEYDLAGRFHRQSVSSGGRQTRHVRYDWSRKDRLLGMVDELTRHGTWFEYDASGNLTGSEYDGTEKLFRVPDAVGNSTAVPTARTARTARAVACWKRRTRSIITTKPATLAQK